MVLTQEANQALLEGRPEDARDLASQDQPAAREIKHVATEAEL